MVMKMNKRIESIKYILHVTFILAISWISTYVFSAATCAFISSNNWLFGIILIPVTLFIAAVTMIVSYTYLKEATG